MALIIPTPEPARFVGNKTITGSLTVDSLVVSSGLFTIASSSGLFIFGQAAQPVAVENGSKIRLGSGGQVGWTSTASPVSSSPDLTMTRSAAGSLTIGGVGNGQLLGVKQLTELTTIGAGVTTDTTILLPANAIILAVSVRVTVVIPVAATFTVGDAGSAARFSTAAVTVAANSTDPGTKAGAYYNATATAVRFTPDLAPLANTGRVRTTIHYLDITPPTS